MSKSIIHAILYVCNIPPVLASILALFYLKKVDSRLYSFNLFLLLNGIIQVTQLVILNITKSYHLLMFHIDVPIEFALLAHFYYSFLKQYFDKKIYFSLVGIFIAFSIFNSIFIQPIHLFNSYAIVAESTILIILSVFAFIVLLDTRSQMKTTVLGKIFELINAGVFVYYSATLLIYYFSNYYLLHQKNAGNTSFISITVSYIFILNSFLAACMFACFIVAMRKHIKSNGAT
jgi:hypothetical protein